MADLESDTKINKLVRACIRLKGGDRNMANYTYGVSICARCEKPVKGGEGQEALQAMASVEGIYFRCKLACECGCSLGQVRIWHDEDDQEQDVPTSEA